MNTSHLTTRQLDALIALAQQRHFTRAAQQCHLSQPAFSALIRSLEDAVGVRLFDRSTRHVELTPEGQFFHQAAQRIRTSIDQAMADTQSRMRLERGRISIALLPSLAADWLPQVLASFCAQHPGIDLQVADLLSEACIHRVAVGEADFALAALHTDTPELQATPFCLDGFHLVCPQGHPLAHPAQPLTAATLAQRPFIHLTHATSVRQCLQAALHPHTMRTVMEVEQLATVAGMVRAGLGISVVPTLSLFHFHHPSLTTRPFPLPALQRQIYIVQRRDRSPSLAAQALLSHLQRPEHQPVLPH